MLPEDDGVLRVLVLHDMEGLAGQEDWKTFLHGYPQYEEGQQMLAADMNAVIEGLFRGGADEIHVVDGHGSTNPEPDYRDDLMDPRVDRVLRDEPFDPYIDLALDEQYDAVAVVGMHARFGSGGFAAHTFTLGTEMYVNGQPVTETEIIGLSFGRVGVPVIFASGDQVLGQNLETMPWIEYVTTKNSTGPATTAALPVDSVRAELTEKARRAVENLDEMQYMAFTPGTVYAGMHYPGSLSGLEGIPGIEWEDGKVVWRGEDFGTLYDAVVETYGANNYLNAHLSSMAASDPGFTPMEDLFTPLVEQWFEAEAELAEGSPEEDSSTGAQVTEKKQYHGSN